MSSNYYGAQAGEIADEAAAHWHEDDEAAWWDDYDPEEYAEAQRRAENPPDSYLEQEAERHDRIHRDQEHGGGKCDCPEGEPWTGEAPF